MKANRNALIEAITEVLKEAHKDAYMRPGMHYDVYFDDEEAYVFEHSGSSRPARNDDIIKGFNEDTYDVTDVEDNILFDGLMWACGEAGYCNETVWNEWCLEGYEDNIITLEGDDLMDFAAFIKGCYEDIWEKYKEKTIEDIVENNTDMYEYIATEFVDKYNK